MKENIKHLENKETEKVTGGDLPFPFKERKCPKCGSTSLTAKPGTMGDILICDECGTELQIW